MSARIFKSFALSRGEKASVLAYAAVIAMAAGMTILIMSGVQGDHLIWGGKSWFSAWVIVAGALSGGIGLALAQGWMGLEGTLGTLRAIVGSVAVAVMAAMIAGLLIDPLLGIVYGPILLMTELMEKPWLAIAWLFVAMAAHSLMILAARDYDASQISRRSDRAVSQLSQLSQQNLFKRG
jgi:hypothetical protein